MLALDDPSWGRLTHAYGNALDVPGLLRALALESGPRASYKQEPWFSLWSSLCHQGDVYTASYAAVPHIVLIAAKTADPIDSSFLQLPAAIEVARTTKHGPDVPNDIADAYHGAIARLVDVVSLHRHHSWDRWTVLSAAAAQAVAKGDVEVAQALLNLDDHLIAKINDFALD